MNIFCFNNFFIRNPFPLMMGNPFMSFSFGNSFGAGLFSGMQNSFMDDFRFSSLTSLTPAIQSTLFNFQQNACFNSFNFSTPQYFSNSIFTGNLGFNSFNYSSPWSFGAVSFASASSGTSTTDTTGTTDTTDTTDTTGTSGTEGGTEVKDGTPITVEGVDYSIFGNDASKVKQLRPEMQKKVQKLWEYAKSKKWKISLNEGFRTYENQKSKYERWKAGTFKAPAVAEPGKSRHEYGCAVDININGKSGAVSAKVPEYIELGKYAKTIGLRQGTSFGENWHFELNPATTPKGRTGSTTGTAAPQKQNDDKQQAARTSYSVTPDSDYSAIYNETYSGTYVNTGSVVHFKYADANLRSTKDMKPAAKKAFERMQKAMQDEIHLTLGYTSAYRGKDAQRRSLNNHTYKNDANVMKKRFKSVAPIGYSEHHTGYALDITINGNASRNNNDWKTNATLKKAYDWLVKNAKRFGFEQSFPANNKQGVIEEGWHWRFVGDADSKRTFYEARKYAGYTDLT